MADKIGRKSTLFQALLLGLIPFIYNIFMENFYEFIFIRYHNNNILIKKDTVLIDIN